MSAQNGGGIQNHPVVGHEAWLAARTAFLAKEKEFTRLRDELSRQRRELPWEKVEKSYAFDGPNGSETLAELFGPCSQLLVYHFMFSPDWEKGCKHCSFWADHFEGPNMHLKHRDVSFAAISRAPLSKIEPLRKRLGWKFKWVSSGGTDFNYDLYASFTPEQNKLGNAYWNYKKGDAASTDHAGASVFYKDDSGAIYHTYSCFARGIDILNGTYNMLDLAPKGRDEDGLKSPQDWVQFHDQYND